MLAIDFGVNGAVVIAGRLDAAQCPKAQAFLEKVDGAVTLECSGLEYISSAGLRSLFQAQKSMAARAGKVLLLNPQPPVQKVFDIVKAADVNAVFRSVAELDAYLDAMQKQVAGVE